MMRHPYVADTFELEHFATRQRSAAVIRALRSTNHRIDSHALIQFAAVTPEVITIGGTALFLAGMFGPPAAEYFKQLAKRKADADFDRFTSSDPMRYGLLTRVISAVRGAELKPPGVTFAIQTESTRTEIDVTDDADGIAQLARFGQLAEVIERCASLINDDDYPEFPIMVKIVGEGFALNYYPDNNGRKRRRLTFNEAGELLGSVDGDD